MEIAVLFGLILLNGFFAMSEMALVTARKTRLQQLAQQGDKNAAIALRLGEEPTFFMSAIQIGITSIGVLNGIVGEAALSPYVSQWLQSLGVEATLSSTLATSFVVIVITYFSIVLGELVPKRMGQISPEAIARLVAKPMLWLAIITRPFVLFLSKSTEGILHLLGLKDKGANSVTEEDIHMLLLEGSDAGVIEEQEHEMVRNVFRLDDRQIASFMIPRNDIIYLDTENSVEENIELIKTHRYSRFPVVKGGWGEVLGVVSTNYLLQKVLEGQTIRLDEQLKPAIFVPESLTGMELVDNFRNSGGHLVFVIDEYGEVQGIVTLYDMMEAITGEFKPQRVEDAWAIQRTDGSWLIDGLIPIHALKTRLNLEAVPEEEKGRYHTLSGMLMLLLARLPQTADICDWDGWRFEIMDMDGTRIDKVLAQRIPSEDTEADTIAN